MSGVLGRMRVVRRAQRLFPSASCVRVSTHFQAPLIKFCRFINMMHANNGFLNSGSFAPSDATRAAALGEVPMPMPALIDHAREKLQSSSRHEKGYDSCAHSFEMANGDASLTRMPESEDTEISSLEDAPRRGIETAKRMRVAGVTSVKNVINIGRVLGNLLVRDYGFFPQFNPFKLSDLQHVLTWRTIKYGDRCLLEDKDLRECYFMQTWKFKERDFLTANRGLTSMKAIVRKAHPVINRYYMPPPCKADVDNLKTKKDIIDGYSELNYVPWQVYQTAVGGLHVLRLVNAGGVGEDPEVVGGYLYWACRASLDASVIRGLARKCEKKRGYINRAAKWAAAGGHTDVIDLLASEHGARIYVNCLNYAAAWGQVAMIDHLVEKYGLNPNQEDQCSLNALDYAVCHDHVRVVKHLVEKYNVNIHRVVGRYRERSRLDAAERLGHAECAAYLRELQ